MIEENIEKNSKRLQIFNFNENILTNAIYLLIIILLLYSLYKFEQYFLYYPISYFIYIIFSIINFNSKISIKYTTIIIIIYLHIYLFKLIVSSIIFLLGGLLKRYFFYSSFVKWIENLISILLYIESCLKKNKINLIEKYINKIILFQKVYNSLKINNITFELPGKEFGENLNDIVYLYNNNLLEKKETKNNNYSKIIEKINLLIINLRSLTKLSFIDLYLKFNYFNALNHLNTQLLFTFSNHIANHIKITENFNILLLKPKINTINNNNNINLNNNLINTSIKTLVIFCNQNAVCSEMYSISKENINYYLEQKEDFYIIIWNYKGYGLRRGLTSFKDIDDDIKLLSKYIQREFNDFKIIIHGVSIGGYSSIKLANELNDEKNIFLIADRTYSTIYNITKSYPFGNFLCKIYKMLFLFEKSDNYENYINFKGNKIMLFDEDDEIIYYSASLFKKIVDEYFEKVLYEKIKKLFNVNKENNVCFGENKFNNLLNFFFDNFEEKKSFLDDLNEINYNNLNDNSFINFIEKIKNCGIEYFIIYCLIFSFPLNNYKEINDDYDELIKNYLKFPIFLLNLFNENKKYLTKIIKKFLINLNYVFIKINLIITSNKSIEDIKSFKYNSEENLFKINENSLKNILNYFGYVHRIFCGHNGLLRKNDLELIHNLLEKKEFISNSKEIDDEKGIN